MIRPLLLLSLGLLAGCAAAPGVSAQLPTTSAPIDTLDPNFVPSGFGTLRQNDVALELALPSGLSVRAIPLDERVIRLLRIDSYKSLRDILRNKERDLATARQRAREISVWYVSFFALEQGETRFSPQELVITNVGRDFRPMDILPLSPGFGEYRLKQREVQSALFVFDGQIDLNQPLSAVVEGRPSPTNWTDVVLRIERERVAVRARAAARKPNE